MHLPLNLYSKSHSHFLYWSIRVSVTLTLLLIACFSLNAGTFHSVCKPTWVSQVKHKKSNIQHLLPEVSLSSLCLMKASVPSLLLFPFTVHWNLPAPPFCGDCGTVAWEPLSSLSSWPLMYCLVPLIIPSLLASCLHPGQFVENTPISSLEIIKRNRF